MVLGGEGVLLRAGTFGPCLPRRLWWGLGWTLGYMIVEQRGGEVLAPFWQAWPHHPQQETILICPPKSQRICLEGLLLQWGQLAAPNLNLWCAPPEKAGAGNSGRHWVVGLWNRSHFPLLSA